MMTTTRIQTVLVQLLLFLGQGLAGVVVVTVLLFLRRLLEQRVPAAATSRGSCDRQGTLPRRLRGDLS